MSISYSEGMTAIEQAKFNRRRQEGETVDDLIVNPYHLAEEMVL